MLEVILLAYLFALVNVLNPRLACRMLLRVENKIFSFRIYLYFRFLHNQ